MGPDNCDDVGRSVCHDAFQERALPCSHHFEFEVARRSWFFLAVDPRKNIDERMNQWWLPGWPCAVVCNYGVEVVVSK